MRLVLRAVRAAIVHGVKASILVTKVSGVRVHVGNYVHITATFSNACSEIVNRGQPSGDTIPADASIGDYEYTKPGVYGFWCKGALEDPSKSGAIQVLP